jgi:GAF domain-containing protein
MPELYFLSTPVSGLEFTIELIATLVPCEAISACLYDINTDEFRFVALSGEGAAVRRASAVASQAGLFGVAKRSPAESLNVANAAQDSRFDAQVDGREGLEVRSLMYLPVRFGGQLLGMLQLINRNKDTGFTTADGAVLGYVSTQLAEFLLSRRSLMG